MREGGRKEGGREGRRDGGREGGRDRVEAFLLCANFSRACLTQ